MKLYTPGNNMTTKSLCMLLIIMAISYLPLNGMDQNAPPSEANEFRLFCAMQRIHDIVEASVDRHHVLIEKGRISCPNPSLTDLPAKAGLFLNTRLSMPDTLSTPWGTVRLTGSPNFSYLSMQHKDRYQLVTQELLQHLRAELQQEKTDMFGWDYKTYKILSIDANDLPIPEMHRDRNSCPADSVLINAWKELLEKYNVQKIY